ncbi:MAG: EAL domain-containing protein [Nitrincola lacisaponensis]|uniref:Sensory box/GGDEF family protein n=1 Tax=Nitrincola lacisaponensis TaxID=267850 RepID=A0A063Y6K7_9GAMM|nr:EAL domain-containing protein [Nitrincola lacisaponensis]KDE40396.1 Sensory box/GGDEF family protein [Nitrincola lacisaponensis]
MNADNPVRQSNKPAVSAREARTNISILFIGFSREAAAATQASLQGIRMAPRCRLIGNERELTGSLAERSWDLVLLSSMQPQDISFERTATIIKQLDKDIPLLLLCDTLPDTEIHLTLLQQGITVACCAGNEKLTLTYIHQSFSALQQRQQWRHCESLLEKAERRIQSLIDDSRTAICFVHQNQICYANERFFELLGYGQIRDLSGLNLDRLVSPAYREALFHQLQRIEAGETLTASSTADILRADTTRFHATLTLNPAVYAEKDAVQIDITQHLADTEIFNELDPISGLLNQTGFSRQLEQQLELARQGGNDGFLFYISLDAYQTLHQNIGQEGTDLLAQEVGKLLRSLVNEAHTLARIDDATFTLLLSDPHQETAKALAREICLSVASLELSLGEYRVQTTCSIGITTISESTPRATELLHRAETAARSLSLNERHGNGYSFYQLEQSKPVVSTDAKAVQRVVDAITHNRFRLLFQPIVPLETHISLANYEVLLRLITDDDKEVSPNIFMSSIADDNVLARMDMWVLEECVMLMRQALDQGKRSRLFINVTGRTLRNKSLLPWFAEQLRSMRLPADHLVFQISEVDALAAPAYYKAFCQALHKLHCLICLKHYGSTSESEYVLADAPVDFIKLDGSYLKELSRNPLAAPQLERIIKPLKQKSLRLIAPMVEDTRQMSLLFRMGIQMVQGHYLQPPQADMDYAFFEPGQD